ncbi:cysteine hydrolase family protein [Paraburkholderia flava]|uniref:cysteine hydrolase family protein n=1 Tax=Paraburkholderia flava TaxID=2547393 RepID=UPI00105B3538|nr:cysteine hydrolase family protein [Paraburkholderia flava]
MTDLAVLVIDVQKAFFFGPDAAYRGDEVVDGINRLTGAARAAGVPVFFVQHDGEAGDEVEPNTDGWQLHPGLVRNDADAVVNKAVGDSFHETRLADLLARRGVERVLICGYATEFCIDTGARSAASLGFRTTIVGDLHTTQHTSALTPKQLVDHYNQLWPRTSLSGNRVGVRLLSDVLATELA